MYILIYYFSTFEANEKMSKLNLTFFFISPSYRLNHEQRSNFKDFI